MSKKLECVLLVDDDQSCNFLHQRVLKKAEVADEIHVAKDGKEAIEFLQERANNNDSCPDVIFLDINMPRMDGWQFLEEYQKLPESVRARKVLIMLTSSLNPDDRDRAMRYAEVDGMEYKLLSEDKIRSIIKQYFEDQNT